MQIKFGAKTTVLDYKKVELAFINDAPIKIELKTRLAISAGDLFDMFEDPHGWAWASIKSVVWETPQPFGEGTTRSVDIDGQGKVQERFFLYEHGEHMAFRFEQGEMKAVSALVEDYAVKSTGVNTCELTWTIGMELRGVLKILTPILRGVMTKQFSGMLDKLTESVNKPSV
ncbi:MAG: SRPBCC family protein [Pseudomonadales bacterium]|nr:SRPBCC family protein [Pseudomonadales bacterium]MDG1443091.1 SRPBCC family protein [Pseudomonadales bacterium]